MCEGERSVGGGVRGEGGAAPAPPPPPALFFSHGVCGEGRPRGAARTPPHAASRCPLPRGGRLERAAAPGSPEGGSGAAAAPQGQVPARTRRGAYSKAGPHRHPRLPLVAFLGWGWGERRSRLAERSVEAQLGGLRPWCEEKCSDSPW